jgi:serine/threonine protein phosphatase PrpC
VFSSGSSSVAEEAESVRELVLYIANAGDCRAVLSHSGVAVELTKDHKPREPSEKERIKAAGGWVHNGRLNGILGVSRAFGDVEHKTLKEQSWGKDFVDNPLTAEPEVTAVMLHEDDEFLILACDGLWDVMTSQQAVNFVRRFLAVRSRDVQAASSALVSKAIALNTVDNVSCMVVALNQGDTDDSLPLPRCRELSTVNSVASGLVTGLAELIHGCSTNISLNDAESDSEYSDGELEML